MRRWRNLSRLKTRGTMVRRYLRGWGWGLRTHHVVGAGFLASAIGMYPIAARLGIAPTSLSSAVGWFNTTAPTIESELESATKDPTEYSKTLPSKIVSAVETLGAQAAAANGIPLNPSIPAPTSRFQNPSFSAKVTPPGAYPSANSPSANSPPANFAPGGYQPPGYQPAGYAGGYPVGYPPPGYPAGPYPPGYQNNSPVSYGFTNPAAGDISCFFSPAGGCTEACVNEIRQAQQQILVQAYSFTSVPIANALVEAHNRGVAVYIVLDKSQKTEQYSGADFVAHAGIPTLIDSAHAIAHNKVMLIDRQTIITGSFNFTTSAEKSNAENLLIIRNRPDLYQAYENNFRHHYEHSQPYQARGNSASPPAHSHMPATNYPPANYGPANYAPANYGPANAGPANYAPANYAAPSNYPNYPSSAPNSWTGPYPQTASPPSYGPTGYR